MTDDANQNSKSFSETFDWLVKEAKSSGIYYDGSIFDKGESAKVILDVNKEGQRSDGRSDE